MSWPECHQSVRNSRDGALDRWSLKLGSITSVFKLAVWCYRFLARLGRNAISVYEAPEMVLLDKKSLKLESIQDFEWSPAADILCAYQSEQAGGNLPARISLIRLPDRAELRQKNLFSVSGKLLAPDANRHAPHNIPLVACINARTQEAEKGQNCGNITFSASAVSCLVLLLHSAILLHTGRAEACDDTTKAEEVVQCQQ